MSSGVVSCGVIVVVREQQSLAPDQEGPQEWPVLHLLREYHGSVPLMFWYFCFLQQSSAQKFWVRTIDGLTMLQFQTVLWAWDQTESCRGAVPQPFSSSLLLKRFHRHSYQHCVLRFWRHSYQYCGLRPQESWAVFFLRLPLTLASKPCSNSSLKESPWKNRYSSSFR